MLDKDSKARNLEKRKQTMLLRKRLAEDASAIFHLPVGEFYKAVKRGEFRRNPATIEMVAGFEALAANSLPTGDDYGRHRAMIQPDLLREITLY